MLMDTYDALVHPDEYYGSPTWTPTDRDEEVVKGLLLLEKSESEIAAALGCSEGQLREAFGFLLVTYKDQADALMMLALWEKGALGHDTTAIRWYTETKLGLRPRSVLEGMTGRVVFDLTSSPDDSEGELFEVVGE